MAIRVVLAAIAFPVSWLLIFFNPSHVPDSVLKVIGTALMIVCAAVVAHWVVVALFSVEVHDSQYEKRVVELLTSKSRIGYLSGFGFGAVALTLVSLTAAVALPAGFYIQGVYRANEFVLTDWHDEIDSGSILQKAAGAEISPVRLFASGNRGSSLISDLPNEWFLLGSTAGNLTVWNAKEKFLVRVPASEIDVCLKIEYLVNQSDGNGYNDSCTSWSDR